MPEQREESESLSSRAWNQRFLFNQVRITSIHTIHYRAEKPGPH